MSTSDALWTLPVNLYALAAASWLSYARTNPRKWTGRKRLIVGGFALTALLGRPFVGLIGLALMEAPPAAAFLLALLFTPALMIFCGIITISGIGAVLSVAFGVLVFIPVLVFTKVMEFENALVRYRYQESGLTGYLVRFSHWLRGETMPSEPPDESKGARFAMPQEIGSCPCRLRINATGSPRVMKYMGVCGCLQPGGNRCTPGMACTTRRTRGHTVSATVERFCHRQQAEAWCAHEAVECVWVKAVQHAR